MTGYWIYRLGHKFVMGFYDGIRYTILIDIAVLLWVNKIKVIFKGNQIG